MPLTLFYKELLDEEIYQEDRKILSPTGEPLSEDEMEEVYQDWRYRLSIEKISDLEFKHAIEFRKKAEEYEKMLYGDPLDHIVERLGFKDTPPSGVKRKIVIIEAMKEDGFEIPLLVDKQARDYLEVYQYIRLLANSKEFLSPKRLYKDLRIHMKAKYPYLIKPDFADFLEELACVKD
jgi:hypothetical protein